MNQVSKTEIALDASGSILHRILAITNVILEECTDKQFKTTYEEFLERIKQDTPTRVTAFEKFETMLNGKDDSNKAFNPFQAFMELKNDPSNPLAVWNGEEDPKVEPSELNDIEYARHESERVEVVVPGHLDDIRRNVRALLVDKLKFFENYDDFDEDSDTLDEYFTS